MLSLIFADIGIAIFNFRFVASFNHNNPLCVESFHFHGRTVVDAGIVNDIIRGLSLREQGPAEQKNRNEND
jgi:hypothetical protein